MEWLIREEGFDKSKIELNGNKYLIGNGYMGYRGTMEEYTSEQLVACNLSGLYDKVGEKWREPVNTPNAAVTRFFCNGELMSVLSSKFTKHEQSLDIRNAVHRRKTEFITSEGIRIEVYSERFLSISNHHLMCMKYTFKASADCDFMIETGIDGEVWDINGPHLEKFKSSIQEYNLLLEAVTHEKNCCIAVGEIVERDFGEEITIPEGRSIYRRISGIAEAEKEYSIVKYISVFSGNDSVGHCEEAILESNKTALELGYDKLLTLNNNLWAQKWKVSDVIIEGDDYAQLALRYSIYHLMIIAPTHTDKASIPARGLSGQVYKGAIFWDTEIFMLPFFLHTNPQIARNLLKYRCNTLEGARKKAEEYGYRGAFYAWESQEDGNDACTYFNITDVFTGRPMRTYFRDKQIHISADVAYAIWQYYLHTGDESLLVEGGAEVIIECARFFYSYSYFNMDKNRYELLDVTGPDEYHERVNNNAYTNVMVKYTLEAALNVIELIRTKYQKEYEQLEAKLQFVQDIEKLSDMLQRLYVPSPDSATSIIQQFDGYNRLEDVTLKGLKARVLNPNEYFGGGNGIATTTKILKQADVVLVLNLFKDRYSTAVKRANWEYYEPITEHGSSLSACVYALVAAEINKIDWAYKYFIKTATIDLTGESKQYVGTLYIGGTHPASNGGAWMVAILGFAGVQTSHKQISINPRLPQEWTLMQFNLLHQNQRFEVKITKESITIKSNRNNSEQVYFNIAGRRSLCRPGEENEFFYT